MTTSRSRGDRPYRMPGSERREHLLDAAARVIAERGLEAVTMESVAVAADVSKGLGYAYFTNRADLLLSLLEREVTLLQQRVGAAMAAADGFEARMRAAVGAWLDVVEESGDLLGTLLQAGQIQETIRQRQSTMYRELEELYGRMAAEEFGIDPRRTVAAAAVLLAGLSGLVERLVEAGDDRALLEETFITVTMGALERMAREGRKA